MLRVATCLVIADENIEADKGDRKGRGVKSRERWDNVHAG